MIKNDRSLRHRGSIKITIKNGAYVAEVSKSILTQAQAIQKYGFLTKNMLKNILYKDIGGFRKQVVIKLGRRILIDEEALLKFLESRKEVNHERT